MDGGLLRPPAVRLVVVVRRKPNSRHLRPDGRLRAERRSLSRMTASGYKKPRRGLALRPQFGFRLTTTTGLGACTVEKAGGSRE